jgi:hypothetical protein
VTSGCLPADSRMTTENASVIQCASLPTTYSHTNRNDSAGDSTTVPTMTNDAINVCVMISPLNVLYVDLIVVCMCCETSIIGGNRATSCGSACPDWSRSPPRSGRKHALGHRRCGRWIAQAPRDVRHPERVLGVLTSTRDESGAARRAGPRLPQGHHSCHRHSEEVHKERDLPTGKYQCTVVH